MNKMTFLQIKKVFQNKNEQNAQIAIYQVFLLTK